MSFTDALLTGLPSDGGAYVPETVPRVSPHRFMNASFETLMVDILPFAGECEAFDKQALREMAHEACKRFGATRSRPW